jgi:polyhydroxybutyrate depolymerase
MAQLSPHSSGAPQATRRNVLIGVVVGLVLVALMGAFVLVSNGRRSTDTAAAAPAAQPSTSLGGSPVGSGQVDGDADSTEDEAVYSACAPIPQTFPLPDRSCFIGVPPDAGIDEQLPAVVLLHGFNATSSDASANGGWEQRIVDDRFVLVRPDGMFSSWNAGGCCGFAAGSSTNDIGYLDAVIDQVTQHRNVDPSQVYLVGESNGGMMAYSYACLAAERLAGIASVGGTRVSGCSPSAPVDTFHAHGTADETVPYEGGQSLVSWVLGVTFAGLDRSMNEWTEGMGCSSPPVVIDGAELSQKIWDCPEQTTVRVDTIEDGRHIWFKGPYDATTQMLDYFGIT